MQEGKQEISKVVALVKNGRESAMSIKFHGYMEPFKFVMSEIRIASPV